MSTPIDLVTERLSDLLKNGGDPYVLTNATSGAVISVRAVKTSAPGRPDGLRDDVEEDPGFSFAVAEAILEVAARPLSKEQRHAVHQQLWMAGTDDWMDYSHLHVHDPEAINDEDLLGLLFSSAVKGAHQIINLCAILKIEPQ